MNAGQRRLLYWALTVIAAGFACGITSLVLLFAWLYTRDSGLMVASRWLVRCDYGLLAGAWLCVFLLWRRRHSRGR